jgi:hypothetical protein
MKSKEKISMAIANCRNRLLSFLELKMRDDDDWPLIRRQVLRTFGDMGLEGIISDYFNDSSSEVVNERR